MTTFLPDCKIFISGSANRQISILCSDTSREKAVYHQKILPSHSTTMQADHLSLNRALRLTSRSRRTAIYGACRSALSIAINNERLSQTSKINRETITKFDSVQLIWYSQLNVSIKTEIASPMENSEIMEPTMAGATCIMFSKSYLVHKIRDMLEAAWSLVCKSQKRTRSGMRRKQNHFPTT